MSRKPAADRATELILRHWREAVPDDRLAHLVKDTSRALSRALQLRLAGHGVSFGHWTFLRVLWETDGITQRELSAQAGVMEPTTVTALNAMERLGYIARRRIGGNRKNNHVFLTARGRALKKKLVPLAEEVNRVAVKSAKEADVARTRRVLLAMIENLAREDANAQPLRARSSGRSMSRAMPGSSTRTRRTASR